MNDKFLKLTNTAYRILEFFPESDPLKSRAKDKVLAIMDNLVLVSETSGWASFQKEKIKVQILEDIDMLLGYLWIAKSQNWLNSVNYLIISNEYEKIRKDIEPGLIGTPEMTQKLPCIDTLKNAEKSTQTSQPAVLNNTGRDPIFNIPESQNPTAEPKIIPITERQKKILEFLEINGKAQVMDLQTVLPDITKRTIRRDLDDLIGIEKITRFGEFNNVFYKLR